jgi:multidrug resistance efflux pump
MRSLSLLTGIAAVAALAACASVPPPTETISAAELALRRADEVDAQRYARLEVYQAREKLEQAKGAVDREQNLEARRLAEESLVEAQLAEAKADAARAERNAEEIRKNIETLESETDRALRR